MQLCSSYSSTSIEARPTSVINLPDITVKAREVFGIDSDLEVPAFSVRTEHVPESDPTYKFDRDTTLWSTDPRVQEAIAQRLGWLDAPEEFANRTASLEGFGDGIAESGFTTVVHDEDDMSTVKDNLGVPAKLRSCHTAQVEKYVIEGHVPAEDIQRLLKDRPKVAGLAVPGMPASSPGMAVPGEPHEPFEVLAFQFDGTTQVFANH